MGQSKGNTIWTYDTLPSTNDQARALIKANTLNEGDVVFTYAQTAGRGQRGTHWIVEPGMNLTFSMVLFPQFLTAERQFFLNQIVTLGIVEALETSEPRGEWRIKWPNDLYHDHRKLGGILIENGLEGGRIDHAIIGIGLNINQANFTAHLPNPVSLYQLFNRQYDLKMLMQAIIDAINGWYRTLQAQEWETIKKAYDGHLYLKDSWHTFTNADGGSFRGKLIGVESNGYLVIEAPSGVRHQMGFKEVKY